MARSLLMSIVRMFGPDNSKVNQDILTYTKTEYKNDWQWEYNRLVDQYNRTGVFGR